MTTQTQLALEIEPVAPLKAEVWWMGFWRITPDDYARDAFIAKYGYEPRVFLRDGAILKVGPIEEEKNGTD